MAHDTFPHAFPHPYKPRLYLACEVMTHPPAYFLRLSCWEEGQQCLVSRQVFELGIKPDEYIVYIGEQGFYIAEELIDQIDPVVEDAEERLEELLYP